MNEERGWIAKIQKTGNIKCADALIRKYYDEIYVYCYRQTYSKETALDLTQDIFIAVLNSINNYDYKKSNFRTWLYRIATNKAIDSLRHQAIVKKLHANSQEMEIPDEREFTKLIENKDMFMRIHKYINILNTRDQQIIRLKLFNDNTFKEIAELISIPQATVKTVYYRILKQLREEFYNDYTDAQ